LATNHPRAKGHQSACTSNSHTTPGCFVCVCQCIPHYGCCRYVGFKQLTFLENSCFGKTIC